MRKGFLAIFLIYSLCAYPNIFKKIDSYIKERIKKHSIKIEKIEYIFPNKFSLSGISYSKDGFSINSDGLLEVNINVFPNIMEPSFSGRVILDKPQFLIKNEFFKGKKKMSLPNIEIVVKDGNGKIENFGAFTDVSGWVKNKKFFFNGCVFGKIASIKGDEKGFEAYIKDANLSLVPFFKIPKKGKADITIKKEKGLEIIADIKNGRIHTKVKDIEKIRGRLLFKNEKLRGRLSFSLNNLPFDVIFTENRGFYKASGNFSYNKGIFPFSIDGFLKDNVFKITKGNIKNTKFFGDIGNKISLYFQFDNEAIPLGAILNGSGKITGNFEKPNISGSLTLTRKKETLDISIEGDNKVLFLKTGTLSSFGLKIASGLSGTISLKPISLSLNLINPALFENGEIKTDLKSFNISFLSNTRRLFLKKERGKITFKYADFIKGFQLEVAGGIILEKELAKVFIEQGRLGEIPINNGSFNIRAGDGVFVEGFKLLLDDITSVNTDFKIVGDEIDAPILITNIKTDRVLKSLKGRVDFKGRLIGKLKNPSIFGQLYSPKPKITGDIAIIDKILTLKNGRVYNTIFEFDLDLLSKALSGFAGFLDEELLRACEVFFIPPHISGRANGSATFSGSLYNPEVTGSITVSSPIIFQGIIADSANLYFNVKDRVFSCKSLLTSPSGFISLNTRILKDGRIESDGNISNFELASLPISSSFSFKGTYSNSCMEGELFVRDIIAGGYKIPPLVEVIQYNLDSGLRLSGVASGVINKGNLDILLKFDNIAIAQCRVKGGITIKGEAGNPEIDGEIEIKGLSLKLPIFQEPFDEVSCLLKIDEKDIRVLSFYGKTKGAKIVMKQIKENTFEVKSYGEPIKVDIPGIIKGEASCELLIKNIEGGFESKGKIIISNARFTYPVTKQGLGGSFLEEFIYGPKIEAGQGVWFYNEFCEVYIEMGSFLRLVKKGDIIKPEGFAYSKRGWVSYLGSNFSLKSANFEFRDGIPYLDGYAELTIDKTPLTLSYTGMVSLPLNLNLSSKELRDKSQDELIKILQKEKPAGIIAGFVGRRITKEITASIRSLTRLDLEVVTPFPEAIFSGTETYNYALIGTGVKIGRYLTKRLYLIYEGSIKAYEEEKYKYKHRIGFEYDIGKMAGLRYLYTPAGEKGKKEYEFGVGKSVSF